MIVSNTSPIINLAAIGLLNLLPELYGSITIPQAVYLEITVLGQGLTGALEVENANWIQVQSVSHTSLVTTILESVNLGEAEAIALSVEHAAHLLLIDERKGRTLATSYGIPITGILGILTLTKQRDMIPEVRSALNNLRDFGFWIDQNLYEYVLQQVHEYPA